MILHLHMKLLIMDGIYWLVYSSPSHLPGRCGHDRMVVGFITTYAISAYRHECCEFEYRWWRGVLNTTLCYKVCQCLATDRWFFPGPPVSPTNKTDRHDIAELLLNKQTNKHTATVPIYLFSIFQLFSVARYECLMPLSSTSHQRPKARIVIAQIKWR